MEEEIVVVESSDEEELVVAESNDEEEVTVVEDNVELIPTQNDYEKLENLPQINSVTLIGNKSLDDLEIQGKIETMSNIDIKNLFS